MKLQNKVAIITGASGILGKSVTKQFYDEGANLVLVDLPQSDVNQLHAEFSMDVNRFISIHADVTKEADVQQLMRQAVDTFKRIDILANIVGGYSAGQPIADMSTEMFDHMLTLNFKSMFFCTREVLSYMIPQKYGKIISVGAKPAMDWSAR